MSARNSSRKATTSRNDGSTKGKTKTNFTTASLMNSAGSPRAGSKTSSPSSKTSVSPAKPKPGGLARQGSSSNTRSIFSFFNNATQRQRSQRSVSPDKTSIDHDPSEDIHDGSDSDGQNATSTKMSKGSSTALAMRKRRFHPLEDDVRTQQQSSSQKFRKTSDGGKVAAMTVKNDDKRPWTDQFAPADLTDIAVHKRKVADVRQWLANALQGHRQKILVLKGSAGTGKTTTLSLLAKELNLEILEWRDAVMSAQTYDDVHSTSARFEEFIARAGRSTGLTLTTDRGTTLLTPQTTLPDENTMQERRCVLSIEEFPSTFSKTSSTLQSFRSVLAQYLASPVQARGSVIPIVMIVSETLLSTSTAAADSFTVHRLLGPELSNHPHVNIIEFNPIAPTFLIKALEQIVLKEARKSGRRRTPGPLVLKHLAETGDIRSAISSLEFLCVRNGDTNNDDDQTFSSKITFTKPKTSKSIPPLTKSESEALRLISNRETSLGIFHAVGKVVYNKRIPINSPLTSAIPIPPQSRARHTTQNPETDPATLLNDLGTDIPTFVAALHENYAPSCFVPNDPEASVTSLAFCAGALGDADLILGSGERTRFAGGGGGSGGAGGAGAGDGVRVDEMAFQVAVRGITFGLPWPVVRKGDGGSGGGVGGRGGDVFRMKYPASLRLWRRREEIAHAVAVLSARVGGRSGKVGGADGVEEWGRSAGVVEDVEVEDGRGHDSEQKEVMVLERLPYMAQMLESKKDLRLPPHLAASLRVVARISGASGVTQDEDDNADGDESQEAGGAESWSTDRPEADGVPNSSKGSARLTGKAGEQATLQSKGLGIPVESKIERLVLEDDDIVDM